MSTQAPATAGRSTTTEVDIAAPVDAVWRALTDAQEIMRWFAMEAAVDAAPAGTIIWSWPGVHEWPNRIRIWEPGRRLSLAYVQDGPHEAARPSDATGAEEGYELIVEFELQAIGGGTRLRLVHSGFGRDASWDDEYEGVRRGWVTELAALRHYLERHAGRDRRLWWGRASVECGAAETWERLAGTAGKPGTLLEETASGLSVRVSETKREPAVIVQREPPAGLVARVPLWNEALLRIWLDPASGGGAVVNVVLSTYAGPTGRFGDEARALLARSFGDAFSGSPDVQVFER